MRAAGSGSRQPEKISASRVKRATAAAFEAIERNVPTSAGAPSKTSGAQKWNGTAESLKARPTIVISPPNTSTTAVAWCWASPVWPSHAASRWAMVGRWAEPSTPRQQAEAVQHHSGGGPAEDGIFQGGLAAGAAMAEDAGQHVAGHAGHFNAQHDHQDVIGRDHDAQADRRAQDHHVELRGVVVVGHARDPREGDEQHQRRTSAGRA